MRNYNSKRNADCILATGGVVETVLDRSCSEESNLASRQIMAWLSKSASAESRLETIGENAYEARRIYLVIFCSDLSFPEGPVVLQDGSWLVVEMGAETGCVTHISPEGDSRRAIAKTGRPNGLAVDKSGFIWIAESMQCALLRMKMEGKVEVFDAGVDGLPLYH